MSWHEDDLPVQMEGERVGRQKQEPGLRVEEGERGRGRVEEGERRRGRVEQGEKGRGRVEEGEGR
jgi:hypothetical protein